MPTNTETVPVSLLAMVKLHAISLTIFKWVWSASTYLYRYLSLTIASAAGSALYSEIFPHTVRTRYVFTHAARPSLSAGHPLVSAKVRSSLSHPDKRSHDRGLIASVTLTVKNS